MDDTPKRKIWMVIDHPQQFALALAIRSYFGREMFVVNLIISKHPYWDYVDISLYNNIFDNIVIFYRPDYTTNIYVFIKNFFSIVKLKREIMRLKIEPSDVIIGFSIFHYVENVILSLCKNNLKFAFMPLIVYEECITQINKTNYRNTIEGVLANVFFEIPTGLNETHCVKSRVTYDTYWLIRYKKSLGEIFDKVIVLGDFPNGYMLGDGITTMPFPYSLALPKRYEGNINDKKKVVFMGTPFKTGTYNISSDIYVKHLNECLSYLRRVFGMDYKLIYRPHPGRHSELNYINLLDLDRFEIETDRKLAELYYYENIDQIYAVFSVESTASRSAFDFLINAYCFFETFPYDNLAKKHFRDSNGIVPDEFYMKDLISKPIPYLDSIRKEKIKTHCKNILDIIFLDI